MNKYYKIAEANSIVIFYHNPISDNIEGVIEEYRTNERLILQKHKTSHYYSNVSNNSLAKGMIDSATEISQGEYEVAAAVADAMLDMEEMYLDVNVPTKKKELKAETTYI